MNIHYLETEAYPNSSLPPEEMINLTKCGKEVAETHISTDKRNVTCAKCLKIIKNNL